MDPDARYVLSTLGINHRWLSGCYDPMGYIITVNHQLVLLKERKQLLCILFGDSA